VGFYPGADQPYYLKLMRPSTKARVTVALAALALLSAACGGRPALNSPVLRLDLRDRLPPDLQRIVSVKDESYPCRTAVTLQAEGASQKFFITWQALRHRDDRHVTALSVEPDGETTGGAHTPVASAAVGELKHDRSGAGTVTVLPLTLSWEARQGCDRVKAKMRLQLRADDKSCKEPPEAPKGLLKPVQ